MAALAYVDVPGYRALLFRRSFPDLNLPGALMDRAREWLGGSAARWNAHDHVWTFPSGASLTFGYLENEKDKYRYQSAELQYIGFDELTQFAESQYLYLFSRLRRLAGSAVPLRMRAASNPGGLGHEWVRARFVDAPPDGGRLFIPARLADNPHLDRDTYMHNLHELDPVTCAQLLEGDWQVHPEGVMFHRDWFCVVEQRPGCAQRVRYWDKAATAGGGARTAGVLIARHTRASTGSRMWSAGSGRRCAVKRSCAPPPSATVARSTSGWNRSRAAAARSQPRPRSATWRASPCTPTG